MSIIAYNVLKVKSGGALIVKLEIVKKVIMTLVFAVTIPISVQAVVWGLVVIAFCEMADQFPRHDHVSRRCRRGAFRADAAASVAGGRGDVRRWCG